MSKGSLEMRLYEFTPEIERLMEEIESRTTEDGEWIDTGRDFQDIVQEVMNMEKDKKEKVLGIGHLIMHLKECQERHQVHAARHSKRAASFEANIDRLKSYIKGNVGKDEKFKDDFVSMYSMKTKIVIPSVTTENLPVEYRRPVLVKSADLDRAVVERLDIACKKQALPSPFTWDIDKETLKKDVVGAIEAGSNHPYGSLQENVSLVVR